MCTCRLPRHLPGLLGAFAAAICLSMAGAAERPAAGIRWREWAPEAFAEALRSDRPILLWIGDPAEPAGPALERALAAAPELPAFIARAFVPVRVDGERRPDVERRYQNAVRGLGGRTGSPLLACLTPDGQALWGDAQPAVEDDFVRERPGLLTALPRLVREWDERRITLRVRAREYEAALRRQSAHEPPVPFAHPRALGPSASAAWAQVGTAFRAALEASREEDVAHPPVAWGLEVLLLHQARTGDAASRDAAAQALRGCLESGLYDRLGGGFHRSAAGRHGERPRFEKLLSLNAEMLPACLHLYQATGDARFQRAAAETAGFLEDVLADRDRGGFLAGQLGARPGEPEGTYYTWTSAEVEAALDDTANKFVRAFFDIGDWGDLPETAPHRNVLFEARPLSAAARAAGLDAVAAAKVLADSVARLRAARERRPSPPLDRLLLVDANARAVSAVLEAAPVLLRPDLQALALKTLDRLLKEAVEPARGAAHSVEPDGRVSFPFLAADETALALACLDAFTATGEARYRDAAREGLARLDARFRDEKTGLYRDRTSAAPGAPEALGRLEAPYYPCDDAPLVSLNALAVQAHLKFAALTGEEEHARRARQTAEAAVPLAAPLGLAGAGVLAAADAAREGLTLVILDGPPDAPEVRALRAAAAQTYAPQKVVLDPTLLDAPARKRWGLAESGGSTRACAWIVSGARPARAASTVEELRAALSAAGRP